MNPTNPNVPPGTPSESPRMDQRIYDTTSVHRITQAALVRDRLTAGITPATVTGIAAVIAQMESQLQAPLLTVTITSAFPGFQRSMSYQNGSSLKLWEAWSEHGLTHHFHDDRASISYSSTNGGMQHNRPLQLFATPTMPQQLPQSQLPQAAGSSASSSRVPTPPDVWSSDY